LCDDWKESIIIPIYKKNEKTDCSNHRGLSLLPSMYQNLSNILLSLSTPYAEEIIANDQCGSTQQISYWSYILLSSITWEKLGIQWI